jgi:hypothetical protein
VSDEKYPCTKDLRSTFTSTTGGVLTNEVGAITGQLELLTRPARNGIEAEVRYEGARDLYTVSGSPLETTDSHPEGHRTILQKLTTPGRIERGNELPVDLTSSQGVSPG